MSSGALVVPFKLWALIVEREKTVREQIVREKEERVEELRRRRRGLIKRRREVEAALLTERKKNFEMRKDLDVLRRENEKLCARNSELENNLERANYWIGEWRRRFKERGRELHKERLWKERKIREIDQLRERNRALREELYWAKANGKEKRDGGNN